MITGTRTTDMKMMNGRKIKSILVHTQIKLATNSNSSDQNNNVRDLNIIRITLLLR